jgi:hypothetical protein
MELGVRTGDCYSLDLKYPTEVHVYRPGPQAGTTGGPGT